MNFTGHVCFLFLKFLPRFPTIQHRWTWEPQSSKSHETSSQNLAKFPQIQIMTELQQSLLMKTSHKYLNPAHYHQFLWKGTSYHVNYWKKSSKRNVVKLVTLGKLLCEDLLWAYILVLLVKCIHCSTLQFKQNIFCFSATPPVLFFHPHEIVLAVRLKMLLYFCNSWNFWNIFPLSSCTRSFLLLLVCLNIT